MMDWLPGFCKGERQKQPLKRLAGETSFANQEIFPEKRAFLDSRAQRKSFESGKHYFFHARTELNIQINLCYRVSRHCSKADLGKF